MTETTQNLTFDEAIKAIFDGKIVEVKRYDLGTHSVWVPVSGVWCINALKNLKGEKFRIRAPTINIGGHSVPKPMTEPPENETLCYMPSLASSDLYYIVCFDGNAKSCKRWLKMGIIHPTKDAAIAHAKALIAISGGEV